MLQANYYYSSRDLISVFYTQTKIIKNFGDHEKIKDLYVD